MKLYGIALGLALSLLPTVVFGQNSEHTKLEVKQKLAKITSALTEAKNQLVGFLEDNDKTRGWKRCSVGSGGFTSEAKQRITTAKEKLKWSMQELDELPTLKSVRALPQFDTQLNGKLSLRDALLYARMAIENTLIGSFDNGNYSLEAAHFALRSFPVKDQTEKDTKEFRKFEDQDKEETWDICVSYTRFNNFAKLVIEDILKRIDEAMVKINETETVL